MKTKFLVLGAVCLGATMATASAAEKLTLYCSADDEFCQVMARGFEAETGINVNMTRKSSGETFAQVKAEEPNPKGDVWWGGTGDPICRLPRKG
jgi:iron(III) transport system substrate-binding protein